MAAALFKELLRREGLLDQYRLESAGTWAAEGEPATPLARAAVQERGLDLDDHRSRRVTGDLLRAFDLVLVMEEGHREALRAEFPDLADRIHLLASMAGEIYDIRDPGGGTLESHRAFADELADLLTRALPRIREALE
jgi:protein-tyrosine phosphatase